MIMVFGLLRLLYIKRPTIVHCHTTMQLPALITPIFCYFLKIRCVIDCHEFDYTGFPLSPIYHNLKSRIVKFEYKFFRTPLAKIALRLSHKIISVAPVCTNFLQFYFKTNIEKIVELNLCVDTTIYKQDLRERRKIREELSISDDEILFIFSGLLSERKKASSYIEILKRLPKNFCLLYVISGTDEEIDFLKGQISSGNLGRRIFIRTGVDSKDIVKYYSASDLGLWLYNNSVSFLEAMACSLPVCISNMQLSYLTNSEHSFILNSSSSIEMYAADIIKLKLESLDLVELGAINRAFIEENYSYVGYSKDLLKIYSHVV
jgi:glycosyltransferase involved in cell wall biosynthesis